MARFRSWIDVERLRALVEETAWRPSDPEPFVPEWGEPEYDRFGRRRRRFVAPDEYFEHDVPQSRRRTEQATQPPRWHDERVRERVDPPPEPSPRRRDPLPEVRRRVEPPPEPRLPPPDPWSRIETPTEPRIERRTPHPNRSVAPPPEPRVPEPRSTLPPPPSFGPGELYEPPRVGSLEDRLAHLLDWATDVSGSDVAFVADHEGLLLARRHASDVEEAVAAVLEGFLEQLGPFLGDAVEGHVTLRSHGRVFVVTWHETGVGRFFLGIVGANPPAPWVVSELASALGSTVADVRELARIDFPLPTSPTPAPIDPEPIAAAPPIDPPIRVAPPPEPTVTPRIDRRVEPVRPHAAPPMGLPAPLAPVDGEPVRFEPPPAPEAAATIEAAAASVPEPMPPAEVAPTRGRMLLDAIAAAFDPRLVRLRISLQTGLSLDALATPDTLADAELDVVSAALQRILGVDPSTIGAS